MIVPATLFSIVGILCILAVRLSKDIKDDIGGVIAVGFAIVGIISFIVAGVSWCKVLF